MKQTFPHCVTKCEYMCVALKTYHHDTVVICIHTLYSYLQHTSTTSFIFLSIMSETVIQTLLSHSIVKTVCNTVVDDDGNNKEVAFAMQCSLCTNRYNRLLRY